MAYAPNADRKIKNGKAMVSAQELADFKEQYGSDKSLRDLLNMDKGLQRKDASNPPVVIPKSMRNIPATESEINPPIVIPKSMRNLPSEDSDRNPPVKVPRSMRSLSGMAGRSGYDEAGNEMKRGGAVKKMSSGGSASSRADGIAQRGKTRGTMVMCGGGMSKGKR